MSLEFLEESLEFLEELWRRHSNVGNNLRVSVHFTSAISVCVPEFYVVVFGRIKFDNLTYWCQILFSLVPDRSSQLILVTLRVSQKVKVKKIKVQRFEYQISLPLPWFIKHCFSSMTPGRYVYQHRCLSTNKFEYWSLSVSPDIGLKLVRVLW